MKPAMVAQQAGSKLFLQWLYSIPLYRPRQEPPPQEFEEPVGRTASLHGCGCCPWKVGLERPGWVLCYRSMKTGPTVGLKDSTPVELEHHGCSVSLSHPRRHCFSSSFITMETEETPRHGNRGNSLGLFNQKAQHLSGGFLDIHAQQAGSSQTSSGSLSPFQCELRNSEILASNWERYPWLTGSVSHKRLYCWECLLFGTEKGAWNWKGYDNLSCLTKAAQKHQNTAGHLKATVTMKTFGDSRIDLQLDEQRLMGETIKEEISKAPFVALMLDETSDVSNAAQLSCVLRFVTDSGVKERFVKFEDKDALKDLFEYIVEHHTNLMMLPFSVLMATYQTWATLNLAFSFQLLTTYLRMQMCSSTSYR
ncbi:hypothetical protein F7725_025441, partial [Dissostichus mawsoni]